MWEILHLSWATIPGIDRQLRIIWIIILIVCIKNNNHNNSSDNNDNVNANNYHNKSHYEKGEKRSKDID